MKTINKLNNNRLITPMSLSIVVLSIFSAFYYATYLLNPNYRSDLLLYVVLVGIELYVILTSVFTWWTILFHQKTELSNPDMETGILKREYITKKVGVIIAIFGEPIELLEENLKHIKNLRGNIQVVVGDDGRREEVALLAKKYGVGYATRVKNEYAKSGNISNIVRTLDVEYLAIFDVDHFPTPDFLEETLYIFHDKKVAFVQTPQYYSNTDNIISAGASGSQNIFYELIMTGKNAFNSAFCVGTNVVFRKSALQEVFGDAHFHLATHSEDIWVAYRLHEEGWKSVYIPKVLAVGLAPETVQQYFRQQERWARGGYEIFLRRNPLFSKSLTLEQKLQYFFTSIHYFSGFVILFYLLLPIIFLFTGIKPLVTAEGTTWLLHFMPFFLSKFVLMAYLLSAFNFSLLSTSLALFPVYIKAFFTELFNTSYVWNVTNIIKVSSGDSTYNYYLPHFFIIILSLVAIVVGNIITELPGEALVFSLWSLLNVALLVNFIYNSLLIKGAKDVK